MKNKTVLFICLLIGFAATAQPSQKGLTNDAPKTADECGIDSIMARKGTWKKISDDLAFPDKTFPRNQYKIINARIDSIYSLLKNSISSLNGFEPRWYRGIRGNSYIPNGPVPYSLETYIFSYYCNSNLNKIILEDETGTNVFVFINRLNWFIEIADTLDINEDGKRRAVYQLPPRGGKWKGMPVYETKRGSTNYAARVVIIGRNGKIPWRTLTQKQYLTGLKNKYQNELKRFKAGSSSERVNKENLKFIDDYMALTKEETLQEPAIIDPKSGIWGFKGKFGIEDAGGFRLVLFAASEKYFDKNLPRDVPQLIELYWSYGKSPSALSFKNQFEENFPIEKLKAMIDK